MILQLKILSMDYYAHSREQNDWSGKCQIKIYILAFLSVIYIQKLYLNEFCIFIFIGSIWVPQIYRNSIYGYKKTPHFTFAVFVTLHLTFIPVMVKGVKNNFLFLKPNTSFTITLIFWVALQLAVLFVQQKKPRFLLTRACIERITENYHRYEHTFEE